MADGGQKQSNDKAGSWIPESRRPDGTVRKARRVKEGYVPPDEAPKYESKGKQWVESQPKLPPGYHQEETEQISLSKNQKKNMRKKQKRLEKKVEQETPGMDKAVEEVSGGVENVSLHGMTAEEVARKARQLKKKIRQIDELQEKIDSGEIKTPEKTQLEKLQKRQELEDELKSLETI